MLQYLQLSPVLTPELMVMNTRLDSTCNIVKCVFWLCCGCANKYQKCNVYCNMYKAEFPRLQYTYISMYVQVVLEHPIMMETNLIPSLEKLHVGFITTFFASASVGCVYTQTHCCDCLIFDGVKKSIYEVHICTTRLSCTDVTFMSFDYHVCTFQDELRSQAECIGRGVYNVGKCRTLAIPYTCTTFVDFQLQPLWKKILLHCMCAPTQIFTACIPLICKKNEGRDLCFFFCLNLLSVCVTELSHKLKALSNVFIAL